ncbi:MAG: hypothetical protein JST30_09035 [Armatimonadetes bacterium]|nr:hypothetical protein [Armatimonadota bacterium]
MPVWSLLSEIGDKQPDIGSMWISAVPLAVVAAFAGALKARFGLPLIGILLFVQLNRLGDLNDLRLGWSVVRELGWVHALQGSASVLCIAVAYIAVYCANVARKGLQSRQHNS